MNNELNIKEIYKTLQGEGPSTGRPATFVRLSGCSLRCHYCDSEYAFEGGEIQTIKKIVAEVKSLKNPLVVITGGEPLDQKNLPLLLTALLEEDFEVELETSGHKALNEIPSGVRVLLDVKTPGSGMSRHFLKENLDCLDHDDILKFVICDKEDFDWARDWAVGLGNQVRKLVATIYG